MYVVRDESSRDKCLPLVKRYIRSNGLTGKVNAWLTVLERKNKEVVFS